MKSYCNRIVIIIASKKVKKRGHRQRCDRNNNSVNTKEIEHLQNTAKNFDRKPIICYLRDILR